MASQGFRQEMPRMGGYQQIDWARKIPIRKWSGYSQFAAFIAFTTGAWAVHYFDRQRMKKEELEMRDARIAIIPLLQAERDRLVLVFIWVKVRQAGEIAATIGSISTDIFRSNRWSTTGSSKAMQRKNRDEEKELMKDVPGWTVGTLWGKPVYHNIRDRYIAPSTEEFFAHCSYWDKYDVIMEKLKH